MPRYNQGNRRPSTAETGLYIILFTAAVWWAFHCPAIHGQTIQPAPQPAARMRPTAPPWEFYTDMLFGNPAAKGVHLHDETIIAEAMLDWRPTGTVFTLEHVSGCGCDLRLTSAIPLASTTTGQIWAFLVHREDGTSFTLTPMGRIGWSALPFSPSALQQEVIYDSSQR